MRWRTPRSRLPRGHLQQEHADLAIEQARYTKTLTDVVEFRFSV